MLGDSAFTRIPGRFEWPRKASEQLPQDPARAEFQKNLEEFCGKVQLSSEWGIKGIKRTWRKLSEKLPSDDGNFRKGLWLATLRLNNFQVHTMQKGQMTTVFLTDCEILGGGLWD